MTKSLAIVISVIALISTPSLGDEGLGEMVVKDVISPVTTSAWIPLAIGSGLTLVDYADRYETDYPLQESWSVRKPLGTWSQYGNDLGQWLPNVAYAAGMAIAGWGFDDKIAKGRTILMLKASIYSGAMSQVLKYSFREPRPNGSNDLAAFPSGHATTAFAFASVVGAEHEWYWGTLAYGMAAFVGASRINDNMHWLHDVIGGATLGMSYGLGLYYRAHPDEPQKPSTTAFQVLPTDRMDGMTIHVFHEF